MRKLLQINATANWGSTGRIAEQINDLAQREGWDAYIAYGRRCNPSKSTLIHIGSKLDVYAHYLEHRLFDIDGLASKSATKKFIKQISELKPDIIHLHNIHDHWLNYRILFEYLNTLDIPVVWTQHDCWSFTGGCGYYSMVNCDKWNIACQGCIFKQGILPLRERTLFQYETKKRLFCKTKNLTLVPVSYWLEGELKKSFLRDRNIRTICNGVNTSVFYPVDSRVKEKYGIEGKALLAAAATTWSQRKGLNDYIELRKLLPESFVILLVGLNQHQIDQLPEGIIGLKRTNCIEELVEIYSGADIVLNLSYEETFGLTTVEGFACGTPSIVYNATASPELVTPETGIIVASGNINGVAEAVVKLFNQEKPREACRKRAEVYYNMNDRFLEYIKLYEELIQHTV